MKPSTLKLQSVIKKRGRMNSLQRNQAASTIRNLRKSGQKRSVRDYYFRYGAFGR